ncbi:hypothetical protein PIB30_090746 [Stylosanthes scabra]|uniref:Uncharacterized protein n=1 Tax=Stylosanthes scabra TaxID=79078 RepID=A0ABU6ZT80_9FABA|nr:hypothetical protein [Stylosanthes scabra]
MNSTLIPNRRPLTTMRLREIKTKAYSTCQACRREDALGRREACRRWSLEEGDGLKRVAGWPSQSPSPVPQSLLTGGTENTAKFGAKVAKESGRNEKIAKKSLKTKSRAYAYAPKEPMRTHCHALGVTS